MDADVPKISISPLKAMSYPLNPRVSNSVGDINIISIQTIFPVIDTYLLLEPGLFN